MFFSKKGYRSAKYIKFYLFIDSSLLDLYSLKRRGTNAAKFISVILVFLCLGHTKTKKKQTNSEPQRLIISCKVLKWSLLVF